MHKFLCSSAALVGMFVPSAIALSTSVPNAFGDGPSDSSASATARSGGTSGGADDHADDHQGNSDGVARPAVDLHPTIVVRGASPEQRQRVDAALARFAEVGLLLPDLGVEFSDDPETCHGHDGLFVTKSEPWQVRVCSAAAYVVTHELAHAWEAANLDDADRAWYMERRHLTTWNSADAAWGDRGVEDLAFMVQQNLMAGRVDARSDRWVERTDAYAWATGTRSPVLPAIDGTSSVS